MSEKFNKVKAILQRPAAPKKFGVDPMEPWSATNQVAESIKSQRAGTLARYLKSRGINPTFVSKDQRIAHTKSDSYRKWMRDHMFEEIVEPKTPSDEQMSVTNKSKHQPSSTIKNPPGTMVRKNLESVELDEVLTKDTTAGETIHDFVHSKNKMFSGDSKAQRIKRALGAYYKKQNEEVEIDETYGTNAPQMTVKKKGVAEGSEHNVGGISHSIIKHPGGKHQVVVKHGDKVAHTSLHNSEEDAKKSLASQVAYSKKMLKVDEQGVAEGAPIVVMPSHKRLEKKHKPSLSRGMDPAKAQGEQDARDGKPYNNPYPFKKELGAPGNWGHISYKASYDSVKKGVSEETLDEISLGDYKEKAKSQSKELKKHTKGEYGGIVQRMLDRRNKGLKMVSKREKASHENTVDMTEENKDKKSASEKMSDYAVKRHKVYQDIQDKGNEFIKKWNSENKDRPHVQIPVKEDMYQDGQSATQSTFDMGNNTDDTTQTFNRVKRAMKKKHVKEDTYDWEKADKSVVTPGKKPKMDKSNEKTGEATTKPKAAAILSGGTTMTGEPRDTIEIDPSMRGRPGQNGGLPSAKVKDK